MKEQSVICILQKLVPRACLDTNASERENISTASKYASSLQTHKIALSHKKSKELIIRMTHFDRSIWCYMFQVEKWTGRLENALTITNQ